MSTGHSYFISFYKEIPRDASPRDSERYRVGMSYKLPGKPSDKSNFEAGIAMFERDNNVTSWMEIAHEYKISEIDYD